MFSEISMFDGATPYKITKPVRLIELFGGIGSQAKALENINVNFEHYRLCEFDKYAVQSYNAVHGTNFKTSDITKINAEDLGITETEKYEYIMTYSFPCTDLSIAGKQAGMSKGSGTRSGLLWEVERLLTECEELPQVLLMENVPQVLNSDFGGWLDFLDSLGYKNYYKKLNAKNFGVPQNRERCFMVSVLGNYYYDFPKGIPLKLRLKDMLESNVDEKYYISNTKIKKIITSNFAQEKAIIQTTDIYGIDGIAPACNTCGGGGLETKIAEPRIFDMYNHSEIKTGICGTLTAHGNTSSTHCGTFGITIEPTQLYNYDYRVRKLTPKECWRLMGFTDSDFDKAKASGVSDSQLYKQAGNSIVVPVLEAIFKNLF